ncbi:hypothetical protein AXF42_Ash017711 [Apostasia shenzhenica]|uniref:Uncharacterized protein n=1 Tax=Apostasia shenzhenica TaxID=1088818 RepID=A0A2I0B613_9ASPA|nr:hypothetical protein AXF42_Ash017711 [Apostasia shenzhenica]
MSEAQQGRHQRRLSQIPAVLPHDFAAPAPAAEIAHAMEEPPEPAPRRRNSPLAAVSEKAVGKENRSSVTGTSGSY